MDVDEQRIGRVVEADEPDPDDGAEDTGHGDVGSRLDGPAPGDEAGGGEGEERDADFETGALDGEVGEVLLAGAVVGDGEAFAVAAEAAVDHGADDEGGDDGSCGEGEVHQSHFDLVVAVVSTKDEWHGCGDAVEACKDDAAECEEQARLLFAQHHDGSEEVGGLKLVSGFVLGDV